MISPEICLPQNTGSVSPELLSPFTLLPTQESWPTWVAYGVSFAVIGYLQWVALAGDYKERRKYSWDVIPGRGGGIPCLRFCKALFPLVGCVFTVPFSYKHSPEVP